MKTIMLKRVAYNEKGTFGVLIDEPYGHNIPFAVTYELPWRDNQRNISCIPSGKYLCLPKDHADRGLIYELQNVPERTFIQIHIGNEEEDTAGCILIGERFEPIGKDLAVWYSKVAMDEMRVMVGFKQFTLIIEPGRICQ